jgi:hypothetical protein
VLLTVKGLDQKWETVREALIKVNQTGSNQIRPFKWLALPMNLDEKAPSPQPSPAEREREKGRQREGNAAKFIGSMRENPFRGNLSPRSPRKSTSPHLSPKIGERAKAGRERRRGIATQLDRHGIL